MAQADAAAIAAAAAAAAPAARDQGRDAKCGRASSTAAASAFIHFHDEGGALRADLKKPGGSGFDRFALDTPAEQRKLVDDAKLRAAQFDDD